MVSQHGQIRVPRFCIHFDGNTYTALCALGRRSRLYFESSRLLRSETGRLWVSEDSCESTNLQGRPSLVVLCVGSASVGNRHLSLRECSPHMVAIQAGLSNSSSPLIGEGIVAHLDARVTVSGHRISWAFSERQQQELSDASHVFSLHTPTGDGIAVELGRRTWRAKAPIAQGGGLLLVWCNWAYLAGCRRRSWR